MEPLVISVTVGYMLKVLKSGRQIIEFKDEFSYIRHGKYIDFINRINGPVGFLVVSDGGVITSGNPPHINDLDFELMLKAAPSMRIFYNQCLSIYGEIKDENIDDITFHNLVLFEISLRMYANNSNLLSGKEQLVDVIQKLGKYKNLTNEEIYMIQQGRIFLNMVKHYKNQFRTWGEGLEAFNTAHMILKNKGLTVF